jgi:hypothetical protein
MLAMAWSVASAHAQGAQFLVTGGVGIVRLQSTAGSVGDKLSGVVIAGTGRASLWKFELDARYAEGKLEARSGTPTARDMVEGQIMFGVRPVPWLSIRAGPHARGYLSGGITERLLLWEARARLDAFIVAPAVRGYVELGGTFRGSIRNGAAPFGDSRLGEAGMVLRFPRAPLWLRLSYAVERTRLASSVGLDAMETVSLALGVGSGR